MTFLTASGILRVPNAADMDRLAAVLVPIVASAEPEVVFIERAHHLRRHAGEIAFPGGAADDGDGGDLARTALRETFEEIGLPTERVALVGALPVVRQRVNRFLVTPYVGLIEPPLEVALDPNEVAATHRVPLAALVAPGAVHLALKPIGERVIETHVFDHGPLHVWGLTGHMLAAFVEAYHAPSELRAALDERLGR